MFDIKNVKPKTMLITGVVSSVVLIIVVIVIILLIKNSKNKNSGRKEVYLQALKPGIKIKPGQSFSSLKSEYSNITLATVQQLEEALKSGLKVCEYGLAIDKGNKEIVAITIPGPGSLNTNPDSSCGGPQRISVSLISEYNHAVNIWVYGVKPPNGTVGVSRFSIPQWSQFDPLPPSGR